jgi:predicted RNA-binding protein with PIN domain
MTALLNLGSKHCKYYNKLFYPQHNRQVHVVLNIENGTNKRYIEKICNEIRKSEIF